MWPRCERRRLARVARHWQTGNTLRNYIASDTRSHRAAARPLDSINFPRIILSLRGRARVDVAPTLLAATKTVFTFVWMKIKKKFRQKWRWNSTAAAASKQRTRRWWWNRALSLSTRNESAMSSTDAYYESHDSHATCSPSSNTGRRC